MANSITKHAIPVKLSVIHLVSMLLTNHTCALVTITRPADLDNTTFATPRYSKFIGDFDEDCFIQDTEVFFAPPGMTLCDITTFPFDVTDMIVMTYMGSFAVGCKEEQQFINAEKLGAAAVIDVAPFKEGLTQNRLHYGFPLNKGGIPVLAIEDTFFTKYIGLLIMSSFGDENGTNVGHTGIYLNITGCDDPNPTNFLINQLLFGISLILGVIWFYGSFLAFRGFRKLKSGSMTTPRKISLVVNGFLLLINGFGYFFGFAADGARTWLFPEYVFPRELELMMQFNQYELNVSDTFFAALYWRELNARCFGGIKRSSQQVKDEYFLLKQNWLKLLVIIVPLFSYRIQDYVGMLNRTLYSRDQTLWHIKLGLSTLQVLLLAFYFSVQTNKFLKKVYEERTRTEIDPKHGNSKSIRLLIKLGVHLAFHLKFFKLFAVVQFIVNIFEFVLAPYIPGLHLPWWSYPVSFLIQGICFNGMSFAKVLGMCGPKELNNTRRGKDGEKVGPGGDAATTAASGYTTIKSTVADADQITK